MKRLIDGKPDVALYNIVSHGFVKYGKLDGGLEFYGRMVRDRVKPDSITFDTLISGRDGKVDEAVGMTHEMAELGCEFSGVTCEILVDGLCRKGKVIESADLMLEFSRKRLLPREFDYFSLIETLYREGKVEKAFELVDELWRIGYVPSLISCTTLIEGLRGIGWIEKSNNLMRKMLDNGIIPDSVTFSCLLQDMCNVGKAVEASELRLLASSKGLNADGMLYMILISGYAKEGRKKEGEIIVNGMLDMGCVPDIGTYNMLMNDLSKCKTFRG